MPGTYISPAETELYYLNTRYYNPEWGRFINADVYTSTGQGLTAANNFAYCGNNPVNRADYGGCLWETILDVISLGLSIADVVANPTDPWAWAGLVGDIVDVAVPFVAGVGEVVDAVRATKTAAEVVDDVHDAAKTADRISEAVDNVNDFRKSIDNTTEVITPKVHGNSLNCSKTNYGYALLDSENNIMKFGETINPTKRYSQKFLSENGLTMQILESGSKTDIHYWQYDMNMYYKDKYGMFPPMNKRGW